MRLTDIYAVMIGLIRFAKLQLCCRCAFRGSGAAPVPATGNATGTASILRPLTILKQSDMDFGELVVTGAEPRSSIRSAVR